MTRWLSYVRGLLATLLGTCAVLWLIGWLARPDLSQRPPAYSAEQIAAAARARDVSFDASDPSKLPNLHVDVGHAQGQAAAWWPKGEAPILSDLVAEGLLPSVADRVGPEPVVMRGVDGIGAYGGTWHRIAISDDDISIIGWRLAYAGLFRWSPLGYPIVPHLAKSVEIKNDNREFVIRLRRGLRWSDGYPFTADDILYWWEYDELDDIVGDGAPPRWMRAGANAGKIEKVDDLTVRFTFDEPHGQFMENMASTSYSITNFPRHYLSRYHPKLGDPEFIKREMAAYQFPTPRALYAYIRHFQNPEHPRMWPWVYRSYRSNPPQVFVRNPYYPVVDEQGNQLPYIDRMQFAVRAGQMLPLSFSNGDASMQARHVRFENYTELMSRRDLAGTRILHWYPGTRQVWVLNPNLNRRVDPTDPDTKWKAQLLGDKRFRQALSLAINRKAIVQAEYSNQVRPSQVDPGRESPFHSEKLATAFIEYNPAKANQILDELGLTQRDIDGMRTFPDGSSMVFHLDFTAFTGGGPAQFIVDDWAEVGVRVIQREQARTLFYTRKDAADFDFNVWSSESDNVPLLESRYFVPPNTEAFYATRWGRWYMHGGFYNDPKVATFKNAEAPPKDHPMYRAYVLYEEALKTPELDKQVELFRQIADIAAENLWTIGIAEAPPQPVVVKKDMRNVPPNAIYSARASTPGNAGIETYFFENPADSPGTIAETKQAIRQITPRPRLGAAVATAPASGSSTAAKADVKAVKTAAAEATPAPLTGAKATATQPAAADAKTPQQKAAQASAEPAASGGFVASFIRWGLLLIAIALLAMVALRHPFVLRRLALMVPTLLVISVIVFSIIQLPPGDYLTSRLIQLQETGDANALKQVEELRQMFHYDEPVVQQYLRWMGFRWFLTFDHGDAGLLQGSMGRSMETSQPVNNLVGDRIELTVLISLFTIVFTWSLAIPIGVYSAVRQYSPSDYVLTLLGFVGMSVPGFLLALVLLSLAGVGAGLFSPAFAAQPEWDWPKFVDLMKHVWIPVVVLGIGGTAGMIRVMRANLLDELRKPYVTTARAKGVRPLKLLFKYPVRVALNPFVSGIGHLFPQLVSGGAIVSIVLALPTVGPLLLSALFSQDMYMAGSMLMVLSLLGVLGTLVSDLLLLWLDPRIRYEGGAR
jgi:ABC-type dipeptide/oligopeptide/nickel transport system permease component/ABC-type transport system substrate-binding protein